MRRPFPQKKAMKHPYFKKIVSFLAILCCLAGSILPVSASEGEVTRVTFTNAQSRTPDLYVTKQAESQTEGYEIPKDIRFSFVLRLDGELVNARAYRVFDESGREVYQYQNGTALEESTEDKSNKVAYKTGRSGEFTLAPGQTAKFEYVGTGVAYEVTETPTEGWEQIKPAGGAAAAGTVTDQGARVTFINTTGGKGGSATLKVKKTVSFPDGYTAPETPDFGFTLILDNVSWKQEPYSVLDEDGELVDTGLTDDAGGFTLQGGQTAVFTEIPENVDYKVTEVLSEEAKAAGWRATGETVKEGTTGKGGVTFLYFNNAVASFAVSKTMQDKSTPEQEFSFLLTDAGRTVITGAEYYLYSTSGNPIMDGEGNPVTSQTDDTGHFTLLPGQTAIFYGIAPGIIYNVREEALPGYVQVVPSVSEGYTDKTVSEAVEVLPFVNRPSDTGLTVTKLVENLEGEAPLEQPEFTFVLRRAETGETSGTGGNAPEKTWTPVADAVYSVEIGTAQYTYKTGKDGSFNVRANETALFTGLAPGEYQVEETGSGMEYTPALKTQTGTLNSVTESLAFTFTNQYTTRAFDLYLTKENRSGEALEGAEFMLYRNAELTNPVLDEPLVTGADGKVTVEDLKPGTYYLVETKAPDDYQLPANPLEMIVTWVENTMTVTVNGNPIFTNTDDQIHIELGQDGNRDQVHIKIYNNKGFSLPLTGGVGLSMLGAVIGAAAALLILLWFLGSRRKSKGRNPKGIK